jgi:hypothetical protein
MSRCSVACLLTVLGACASQPRYIVTSTPLKLIDPAHPGLCIAIDPKDPKGDLVVGRRPIRLHGPFELDDGCGSSQRDTGDGGHG